ncbi:hypothetical protein [Bradyrhizobium diazoefficiens]
MPKFTSILSGLGKARGLGISPENCEIHTHNLKVIGSNPIPATKFGLHRFRYENGPHRAGHFCFAIFVLPWALQSSERLRRLIRIGG